MKAAKKRAAKRVKSPLTSREFDLILDAVERLFRFHKRGALDCDGCTQPDNEVERQGNEHRSIARECAALFKKLGGVVYTTRTIKVPVKGGLK